MTVLILLAGLLVSAPGAFSPPTYKSVGPRVVAALIVSTLAAAAVYVTAGIGLLAAPSLMRVVPTGSAIGDCLRRVDHFVAGGLVTSTAMASLLASGVGAALWRARRSRKVRAALRVPPELGDHQPCEHFDLVVLPIAVPLAYSIGGRDPQAVITQGLLDRLDEVQVQAVIAHEAAHLRLGHQRWIDTIDLAAGVLWFVPWVRRAAKSARISVECWADEEAAAAVGRSAVRSSLLAAADAAPLGGAIAAINGAETIARRIAILDRSPAPLSCFEMVPATALALAVVGATTATMSALPHLVGFLSGWCPL